MYVFLILCIKHHTHAPAEAEILLVAPQHARSGLHRRLGEHVMQQYDLIPGFLAHYNEHTPLPGRDAILYRHPQAVVDLLAGHGLPKASKNRRRQLLRSSPPRGVTCIRSVNLRIFLSPSCATVGYLRARPYNSGRPASSKVGEKGGRERRSLCAGRDGWRRCKKAGNFSF